MRVSGTVRLVLCLLITFSATVALASPPESGYHLLKKVPLGKAPGGAEYFDYITVDADARRVYVSHGTEVKVVDADSFAVVGTISGLKKCHGVALVPELGKGFITDGNAATVVVFDTKSLKTTGEIKSYPDTDSIVYDPASKLIFAFNGDSKNASVIDPAKENVLKTLDLGGGPEQAVADGKGMVYDNNEETSEVLAIDSRALTIKTRWKVAPAGQPVALALDSEHARLFSSGRQAALLVMMDADSGKVLQSFPISEGVDGSGFDPTSGLVFASTRAGKLHIFHEDSADKLSPVETIDTEYGAKTMAIDPKTHNVFLSTADFGPASGPKARRQVLPGTAHLLVYGNSK
jgi:DNA-binding beta-propeller fold protein YncE